VVVSTNPNESNDSAIASTVTVSMGKGDGTFETPVVYSVDRDPGQPVILDINQDGKPDIAVPSWDKQEIEVLLGKGDGTFQPAVSYLSTTQVPNFMIGGDYNGDGRPDLVATTSEGSAETVILNQGTTTVQLANVIPPTTGAALVVASYPGDAVFRVSTSNSVELSSGSPRSPIYFGGGFSGSGATLKLNGTAALNGSQLQLTSGATDQAGSAFYATPVNIQSFTTDFSFQLSSANGDGFTFTIQNLGPEALGRTGGSLGYASIPKSVGIKFDLYNDVGEGRDSTGLYLDGATPTTPAINLVTTGIDLHSGHPMSVHIAYNTAYRGGELALTIIDETTKAAWSNFFAVDIPKAMGGITAYVGFTGATGALTSTQMIGTWTFVPGTP
jgi:hypothetical protein